MISIAGGILFFVILMYKRRWLLRILLSYRGWMCKYSRYLIVHKFLALRAFLIIPDTMSMQFALDTFETCTVVRCGIIAVAFLACLTFQKDYRYLYLHFTNRTVCTKYIFLSHLHGDVCSKLREILCLNVTFCIKK